MAGPFLKPELFAKGTLVVLVLCKTVLNKFQWQDCSFATQLKPTLARHTSRTLSVCSSQCCHCHIVISQPNTYALDPLAILAAPPPLANVYTFVWSAGRAYSGLYHRKETPGLLASAGVPQDTKVVAIMKAALRKFASTHRPGPAQVTEAPYCAHMRQEFQGPTCSRHKDYRTCQCFC